MVNKVLVELGVLQGGNQMFKRLLIARAAHNLNIQCKTKDGNYDMIKSTANPHNWNVVGKKLGYGNNGLLPQSDFLSGGQMH